MNLVLLESLLYLQLDNTKISIISKLSRQDVPFVVLDHIYSFLLVSDPLPEPNSNRPTSMTGNMAGVPLIIAPTANKEEPSKQRPENRNRPTEIQIIRKNGNDSVRVIIVSDDGSYRKQRGSQQAKPENKNRPTEITNHQEKYAL